MNRRQLIAQRQPLWGSASAWMGSTLVHLIIAGVVLQTGYFRAPKADVVHINLSQTLITPPPAPRPRTIVSPPPVLPRPKTVPPKPEPVAPKPIIKSKPLVKPKPVASPKPLEALPITKAPAKLVKKPEPAPAPEPERVETPVVVAPATPPPVEQAVEVAGIQPDQTLAEPRPATSLASETSMQAVEQVDPLEVAREGYVQHNFKGIRTRVTDNLRYPSLARRQGWYGQVQVRFKILLDGAIEELEVLSSSGYPMLDRQALKAIERAAPFPAPPVIASITLPVNFELK